MNPIFTKMVDAVEATNAAPDDYINSADGLKYCASAARRKKRFIPQTFRRRALPSTRLCAGALSSAANGKKRSAGNTSECPI